MHWSTLVSDNGGWGGLLVEVDRPVRPGLRVEVASGGHMAIVWDGRAVLWGRLDGHFYGIEYCRTGHYRSPVPPLRAEQARRMSDLTQWAYYLARTLTTTAGPLHAGRWTIRPRAWGRQGVPLRDDHPEGYLDWFAGEVGQVIPLRGSCDPGRVRGYRKLAREGILPPVLLWWISGLCSYVVVDGHARLAAAAAEGVEPVFLALERAADQPSDTEEFLRKYARQVAIVEDTVARGVPGARQALADLQRTAARTLNSLTHGPAPTRAWPMHPDLRPRP